MGYPSCLLLLQPLNQTYLEEYCWKTVVVKDCCQKQQNYYYCSHQSSVVDKNQNCWMYLVKTVDYNVEEYVGCYGLNVKIIEIGIDHQTIIK